MKSFHDLEARSRMHYLRQFFEEAGILELVAMSGGL